ncbi:hypothetical protein RGU12_22905 [Fredinandcohnia sp. QZ13]|uniref:hypothetical protein n=1 Tax=Fredinandcohnia sp. QZ13 TaxID=3073144 RepID=UPI0028530D19|nr:hypothetical protein [Fredinandcohnia sp. QZ13]MDR4890356.1 hypothetical protein [Fredinandcohnia sp. QZ13]
MDIPTVLSGPILRRVEPSHIYIWIALSKRYKLGAKLYQVENKEGTAISYHEINCNTETTTFRAGKQLYISLIKLTPHETQFPIDTLLGYNIFFQRNAEIQDLHDFGLLGKDQLNSITYGDLPFPSFFIPDPYQKQTNLLYGSCRKLHGKGEDALSQGDETIERNFLDLEKRPSALFLLGDQIYADDVPNPVFPIMVKAGKELIGKGEKLTEIEPRLNENPFKKSIFQTRGRQYIMESFCKFTSSHSGNHAMTFGEYATLYLLSWSPELWNAYVDSGDFPAFKEAIEKDQIYFIYQKKKKDKRKKEEKIYKKEYKEHVTDVKETYQTLSKVRRLLANIPTYMIFDDHDITDDWNISHHWKSSVHQSNLGRHVIANGLMAYWLFQAWGNDPDRFDQSFLKKMWKYSKSYDSGSRSHEVWKEALWNFDEWHFVAPTNPTSIFLDTRTQRKYDPSPLPVSLGRNIKEKDRPPQLIGEQGWHSTTDCLYASGWKNGEPLLVVSPTPVYGIGLIESFLNQYIYPLKTIGVPVTTAFDFESWKYNGEGFSELLNQVKEWHPSHCLILSGDVHYASAVKTNVEFNTGENLCIYQFTSSPMNNMSFSGIQGGLMKAIVTINAAKRRNKEINRYCDETYDIVKQKRKDSCPANFTWKEKIRYLSTNQGPIIETDNNLGHLILTQDTVQNVLLQTNNIITYDPIPLT